MSDIEIYEEKMRKFIGCVLRNEPIGKVSAEDAPALRSCIGVYMQGINLLENENNGSVEAYYTTPYVTIAGLEFYHKNNTATV